MYQSGELELELKALRVKERADIEALEKLEPIYSTLKKLKRAIEERGIKGYKGLLVE